MAAALKPVAHARITALIGLVIGVLAALMLAPAALAHDSVIDAEPGIDASVEAFPRTITLVFSGEPRPNFNRIAVSNATTQEVLFSGEPALDGRIVSIEVPAGIDPGPGEYVVGFQITSSDGHATRGKTTFRVLPAGAAEPDPAMASESGADEDGSTPGAWVWVCLGVLGFAIAVGISVTLVVARRKAGAVRTDRRESPSTSHEEH